VNYAAAIGLLDAAGKQQGHQTLMLKVETWLDEPRRICWSIWCGDRSEHYYGGTFQEALAKYEQNQPELPRGGVDSVGEISACECGAVFGETHDCPALPRMDTPEMMGTESSGIDPARDAELDEAIRARGLQP
jgi:hypothetical protein